MQALMDTLMGERLAKAYCSLVKSDLAASRPCLRISDPLSARNHPRFKYSRRITLLSATPQWSDYGLEQSWREVS
ncbi:hypothetical protein TNCV_4522471 [Trichonephila clavipes]|nr:hypothetical protein TNCV_4522471 [Trichonephila clavipes]